MARVPPDLPPAVRARFWARYAAWSLDAACLLPLVALLSAAHVRVAIGEARVALDAMSASVAHLLDAGAVQPPVAMATNLLLDPRVASASAALQSALATILLTPVLVYALLAFAWTLGFESSAWRATPGKRALGLVVATRAGGRPKPTRVIARYLASGLSWLTLNLGHALVLLPPAFLALHDRVSETRVLRLDGDTALPAWARAWLGLQALAFCVATGWLFVSLQAAMQAAMQRAMGGL